MIPSTRTVQRYVSYFQLLGTLTALLIAMIGGVWYLALHRNTPLQVEIFNLKNPIAILSAFKDLKSTSPLELVEIGLTLLIATQVLRVLWLFGFYIKVKDLWFSIFTGFVLCAILYSLFMMG